MSGSQVSTRQQSTTSPRRQALGVAAAAAHADPAEQPVGETAEAPHPVAVVPAVRAADAPDGRERGGRRHRHVDRAGVNQPRADADAAPAQTRGGRQGRVRPAGGRERCVLLLAGPRQRLLQPERTDRGTPSARRRRSRRSRSAARRRVRGQRGRRPAWSSPSHRLDRRGVSSGTGTSHRRSPRCRAYSRMMLPYETTSAPAHLEPAPLAVRQVEHRHEIGRGRWAGSACAPRTGRS